MPRNTRITTINCCASSSKALSRVPYDGGDKTSRKFGWQERMKGREEIAKTCETREEMPMLGAVSVS